MQQLRWAATCLLLTAINQLSAQVRFQVITFTEGVYPVDKLFQFSLVNMGTVPTHGQVIVKLTTLNGELVSQYTSVPTDFKALETVLGTQLDWLKTAEVGTSSTAAQFQEQGILPYGKYVACYSFSDGKTQFPPFCSEIISKPQLPPRLNTPSDKATIVTTNPLLTWLPPMPDFGTVYQYHLRLVEQRSGQTCAQALQQNTPIVDERGQEEQIYQMTDANGLGLEVGKTYCWQVGAYTKSGLLGNTDMWAFTVGSNIATITEDLDMTYTYMKPTLDGEKIYVTDSHLYLIYDHPAEGKALTYSLRKESDNSEWYFSNPPTVLSGRNYLKIPINSLTSQHTYRLEVTGEKNLKYYCRFVYEN